MASVFWEKRDTKSGRVGRGAESHALSLYLDRSCVASVGTKDNSGDFGPSRANQPYETEDLACLNVEANIANERCP